MTTHAPPNRPHDDQRARRPLRSPDRDIYLVVIIGVVIVLIALLIVLLVNNSDSDSDGVELTTSTVGATTSETTATTSAVTPTTASQATTQTTSGSTATTPTTQGTVPPTSQSTAPPTTSQPVVWPAPGSNQQYATPEAAAVGFADFIGYDDPVLGEFRAGDNRSGEIELQPRADGPVSTIALRQVGPGDSWSVIAVTNENIVIDEPSAGALIANPLALSGQARAFEGHVDVRLYAHGQAEPVAVGFVTGSGDAVLGPFEGALDWPATVRGTGTLVLLTTGGDDGSLWDVAAVPVRFS